MKNNRIKQRVKLGWGTLTQYQDGWKVRWTDSSGSRRLKPVVGPDKQVQLSRRDAVLLAEAIFQRFEQMARGSDVLAPGAITEDGHLGGIFHDVRQSRTWIEKTAKDYEGFVVGFLKWCDSRRKRNWSQLSTADIKIYEKSLWDRGLAKRTVELYLWPIKLAAKWAVHRGYTNRNIMDGYRQMKPAISKTYEDTPNRHLTFGEVLDFMDSIEVPGLRLAVALQGIAGMRLTEALRLTPDKIDFEQGTITIDGMVKNSHSVRKIPVASVVLDCLRDAPEMVSYSTGKSLGSAISLAMSRWNESKRIPPKDLRNTLQTEAVLGGWYGYFLELYVGHSPKSVGQIAGKHYVGLRGDDRIPHFRDHVSSRIEGAVNLHREALADVVTIAKFG